MNASSFSKGNINYRFNIDKTYTFKFFLDKCFKCGDLVDYGAILALNRAYHKVANAIVFNLIQGVQ